MPIQPSSHAHVAVLLYTPWAETYKTSHRMPRAGDSAVLTDKPICTACAQFAARFFGEVPKDGVGKAVAETGRPTALPDRYRFLHRD